MNSKKDKSKNQNVQVFVRCRPHTTSDVRQGSVNVVECGDGEVTVRERTSTRTFNFDKVFGPLSRQTDLYRHAVRPVVEEVLQGYNCTVFAYGQTGTGKTFTMAGERGDELAYAWEDDPLAGVIPRAMAHLFDALNAQAELEFSVRVSYLELYNEELFDLLNPSDEGPKLRIFDDAMRKGSVVVQGAEEVVVNDKSEVFDILERGSAKRRTASTLINASSSRSHSVFCVTVHMRDCTLEDEELVRIGKLNLVDLAGSENVSRSGAVHGRAREAGNINQSLLTLGRVIMTLAKHEGHIPYRDSKLTRLLQDALGGRSKTTIIATISPTSINMDETLSTLEYAHRAKSITNRPEVNQRLNKRALIKEYLDEMERLRRDLAAQREKNGVYIDNENYSKLQLTVQQQRDRIRELDDRLQLATTDFHAARQLLHLSHEETEAARQAQRAVEAELGAISVQCDKLRQRLLHTEAQREAESYLKTMHTEAEVALRRQALQLLDELEQSDKERHGLHSKVERILALEQCNQAVLRQGEHQLTGAANKLREHLANENERVCAFRQCFADQLSDDTLAVCSQLEQQGVAVRELRERLGQQLRHLAEHMVCTEERRTVWTETWKCSVLNTGRDVRECIDGLVEKCVEGDAQQRAMLHDALLDLDALNKLSVCQDADLDVLHQQVAIDLKGKLEAERQAAAADRRNLLQAAQRLVICAEEKHNVLASLLTAERERMCDLLKIKNEQLIELVSSNCAQLENALRSGFESAHATCATCPEQLTDVMTHCADEAIIADEMTRRLHELTDQEVQQSLFLLRNHSRCTNERSEKHVTQLHKSVVALNESRVQQHELFTALARDHILQRVTTHCDTLSTAFHEELTAVREESVAVQQVVASIDEEQTGVCANLIQLQGALSEEQRSRDATRHSTLAQDVELVNKHLSHTAVELSALERTQRRVLLEDVAVDRSSGTTPLRRELPTRALAVMPFSPDERLVARFTTQRNQRELEHVATIELPLSEQGSLREEHSDEDVHTADTLDEDSGAGSLSGFGNENRRYHDSSEPTHDTAKLPPLQCTTPKKTFLPLPLRPKNR